MRRNIIHEGAANLRYEIREIVKVAHDVEALGQEITWENIGDPVQKGEAPPDWIREIVRNLAEDPRSWAYCDSAGILETREFLAERVNMREGVCVTPPRPLSTPATVSTPCGSDSALRSAGR